jgi:hypothetical protein
MTFRRLCLGLVLATGLASCAAPPPPPRFPEIRFTQEPPIQLEVARVELVARFQPGFAAPEVEHEFAVPPQRALEALYKDRLRAVAPGSGRLARFIILDASVREAELPRTGGIKGAFTVQQAQRYDGRVAVRLEIIDEHGLTVRTANAEATHSRSVAEDITPNERDQVWYDMAQELARSLDHELERQINASFYPFTRL